MISFHSLEDRIVKTFIARESRDEVDRRAPLRAAARPMRLQRAGPRQARRPPRSRANPRARSAVLRVAERTDAPERAA
ncbi:MAG: 16S rRNA (cytosine(1402)-N(4))-methyltransferase [Comamonadaceae bacterium]|nr:16S rRNA (cytosine(1402)-N(4))-methyltransferase [Comamonadaceae bacterium]